MIQEITNGVGLAPENIPEELTERPQWVCWRYARRGGKQAKVPYTATGHRASTTDLMHWTTCANALAYYNAGHCDGIGFVFSSGDPYAGIDLDNCRNPETGEVAGWAQEILERVGDEAYVEASPSGAGIHIIVEGKVRGGGGRKGNIEMYSSERFFTITGKRL